MRIAAFAAAIWFNLTHTSRDAIEGRDKISLSGNWLRKRRPQESPSTLTF